MLHLLLAAAASLDDEAGASNWGTWDGLGDGTETLIEANSASNNNAICLAPKSDTEIVAFYCVTDGTITAAIIDCGASGTTATVGTPDDFYTTPVAGCEQMAAIKIDTDKWLVSYQDKDDDDLRAIVVTYSGGFSAGSNVAILGGTISNLSHAAFCEMGSGYWALAFNGTGSYDHGVALLSVSGTTITEEDKLSLDTAGGDDGVGCCTYSDTEIVCTWSTGTDIKCGFVSRSGTTLSLDDTLTIVSSMVATKDCSVAINDATKVMALVCGYETGGTDYLRRSRLSWSGSALSESNSAAPTGTGTAHTFNHAEIKHMAGNHFLMVANDTSGNDQLLKEVSEVTASGITVVDTVGDYTFAQGWGIALEKIDADRALVAWRESTDTDFHCAIISAE